MPECGCSREALEGDAIVVKRSRNTNGFKAGLLSAGGVEWMQAGGGVGGMAAVPASRDGRVAFSLDRVAPQSSNSARL